MPGTGTGSVSLPGEVTSDEGRRWPGLRSMETLFLLIEIEVGRLEEVVRRLKAIAAVTEVEAVTGPFDLIVKVQAKHINEALDIVVHKIRRITGIKSTETLVTVSVS
jgi:DNA-binding Lrp family transcriptional regulator